MFFSAITIWLELKEQSLLRLLHNHTKSPFSITKSEPINIMHVSIIIIICDYLLWECFLLIMSLSYNNGLTWMGCQCQSTEVFSFIQLAIWLRYSSFLLCTLLASLLLLFNSWIKPDYFNIWLLLRTCAFCSISTQFTILFLNQHNKLLLQISPGLIVFNLFALVQEFLQILQHYRLTWIINLDLK